MLFTVKSIKQNAKYSLNETMVSAQTIFGETFYKGGLQPWEKVQNNKAKRVLKIKRPVRQTGRTVTTKVKDRVLIPGLLLRLQQAQTI
jgi:hypothetical protein